MTNQGTVSVKVASSRVENGIDVCNTCVRPANAPYRYRTAKGETRGCIASCHDVYVRYSKDADWVTKKRYRLPKWITEARTKITNFERVTLEHESESEQARRTR